MESYSDNINLVPSGGLPTNPADKPKSSLVTMIAPGFFLTHKGVWKVNLSYQMQNLFYAGDYSSSRIQNQMFLNSGGKIFSDSVYLSLTSLVGQYNNAGRGLGLGGLSGAGRGSGYAVDNISRTNRNTDYQTYRIAPYWMPKFDGYANANIGLMYSYTSNNSGTINSTSNSQYDSNMVGQYATIFSGREFSMLGWRGSFFNNDQFGGSNGATSGTNGDVSYQSFNGQIQYRLWEHTQPFIQGGYYNNKLGYNASSGTTSGANNGGYWNVGLIWTPSPKTFLQAGAGANNYFFSVRFTPSRRTDVIFTFRHSDVGCAYGGNGYGSGGFGNQGYGTGGGGFGNGAFGYGGGGVGGGYSSGFVGSSGYGLKGGNSSGKACMSGKSGSGTGSGSTQYGSIGNTSNNNMGGLNVGNMNGVGGISGFGGMGMGSGGLGAGGVGGLGGIQGISGLSSGFGGFGSGFNGAGGFNSGSTVNGGVCHRTRHTYWQAYYTEYITTQAQELQNTTQAFVGIDQPTATNLNQVITRKRGQAGVLWQYPRTNVSVMAFQENRNYQGTGTEDLWGLTGMWNWKFTRRTMSQFAIAWQSMDSSPNSSGAYNSEFALASLGVYHSVSQHLSGGLTYRFTKQTSEQITTGDITENRVMATVFMSF